jgi:hypothetical protein
MRRVLIVGAGTAVVLLVLSQLLLPGFLQGEIEDRLTEDGGTADVTLKALPAVTLLAASGSEARLRGSGLTLDLDLAGEKPLDELDGFDKVDADVRSSQAGPFNVDKLVLRRAGRDDPYTTRLDATVTGRDLATFAGSSVAGPLGSLIAGLAAGAVDVSDAPIPIHLNATIESDGGEPRVESADGTIAGLPAGPLLAAVVDALARSF